jgi:basic membrane protein A
MTLAPKFHSLSWLASSLTSSLVTCAVLGAASLGCSKSASPEAAATSAASVSAPAPAPARPAGPLKVAFAYVGPVGDAGWTFAHDRARKEMQAQFGDKVTTSFVENVPEGADAERVFRDMISQGNTLIFGTTFGYMEPMLRVAGDAKAVKFEHATGYKIGENLRTYDSRTYEGAYLAGIVAGSMTKTNELGVVASIPIPEVIRNINSFTLGAQSVNPKVTTRVVWINKWFDPPKETEAAQALINQGVDVLMQNTDSSAVLQTAEKAGKWAFGWDSDMSKIAPKAHLASAVINWAPYYEKAVGDVLAGTWKADRTWWGVKEGAIDLVSISDKVPAAAKAKVDQVKAGLKDGSFVIWKGPLQDQTGKERLVEGQTAQDGYLAAINFYVKGVEGKVPSSG